MKTKKFLNTLASFIGATSFCNIMLSNNVNNQTTMNSSFGKSTMKTKTFDASKIGAIRNGGAAGTFTIKYVNPDNCILTDVSHDFIIGDVETGDYYCSFCNGCFIDDDDGIKYTIAEIDEKVFNCYTNWYFYRTILTIPPTIKKIGESAFNGCSEGWYSHTPEIISLCFQEGLEYIGPKAFRKCDDMSWIGYQKGMWLPNSLKFIGYDAFSRTGIEEFDLTALDHVIDVDCDVDSFYGCLPSSTKKIYVKSQEIKDKYLADKHWHNIAEKKMFVKQ